MRRVMMLAATLVIPVAGVAIAIGAGPCVGFERAQRQGNLRLHRRQRDGWHLHHGVLRYGYGQQRRGFQELSETSLATGGPCPWVKARPPPSSALRRSSLQVRSTAPDT